MGFYNEQLLNNILAVAPMTQLIIGPAIMWEAEDPETHETDPYYTGWTLPLPYTSKDNYSCYTQPLERSLTMISGREIKENRGNRVIIEYKYDHMPLEMWNQLAYILRLCLPFEVYYLSDDDPSELRFGRFVCEKLKSLRLAGSESKYDVNHWPTNYYHIPLWHGVEFRLRSAYAIPTTEVFHKVTSK